MRSRDGGDKVLDHVRLAVHVQHLEINNVLQLLRAAVETHHACSAGDDLLALVEVLCLPDVPCAVDHGVVEPEGGVAGGDVEVCVQKISIDVQMGRVA